MRLGAARTASWLAVIAAAGCALAYRAWQQVELSLPLLYFGAVAVMMVYFLALSAKGRTWYHFTPARGRIVAVIPAYNEKPELLHECIKSLLGGWIVPDVVHVVDDGSDPPAPVFNHPRVQWHRQKNQGKRMAQINVLRAEYADFILTMDSDSRVSNLALLNALKAMSDTEVQAVTATITVMNRCQNWLTRLRDLELVVSCLLMRSARSAKGAVAPTSGAFALYRAELIYDNLDDYVSSGTAGDDRRLTHYALLKGHVVALEDEMVDTEMPHTLRGTYRQLTRWFKSYFRYLPWELRHLHGLPLYLRSWNLLQIVLYPVLLAALVVFMIRQRQFYWQPFAYWLVLQYVLCFRYVTYVRPDVPFWDRLLTWLIGTPFLIPLNLLVARPAMVAGALMARTTHWQGRESASSESKTQLQHQGTSRVS